jgi:hypothetical protein
MTAPSAPRDPDLFAIIPVYGDSAGHVVVPKNAAATGSWSAVMERILDSRTRKEALTLLNDAAHATGRLESIRELERSLKVREDAIAEHEESVTRTMLQQAIHKMDALSRRMDAIETERAKDPDDDILPRSPGIHDEGELEPKDAPEDPDLPRSPAAMEDN